jgi:hypothetical protein
MVRVLASACALAVATYATTVLAQQQGNMPGMTMPMTAPKKADLPPVKKKTAAKQKAAPSAKKKATSAATAEDNHEAPSAPLSTAPAPEPAMPMGSMDHMQMDHGAADPMPMDHAAMGHGNPDHAMAGAYGSYPMTRESSGTAWQPDKSEHSGVHVMSGEWTLMGHGVLNLVYDHQSGPRGDDKAFASGMLIGMARRPLGNGTLQLKAMLSPDPLMGRCGYPLLLASGETADGITHLVDRQHPHDFFMELSASVSHPIGGKGSVFLYGGLPGEPAFGPPAFMHREAILDSPEAPISHHWLDSTHNSFGVLTAGLVLDRVKLEVSRFNGREPDQHRWNIETAPLDSTALRLSWNPTASLSLRGSWGYFKHPEQLEPEVNQKRLSASLLYANDIAPGWKMAGTLAWGRKSADGYRDDAFAAEASLKHRAWTIFSRAEMTDNRELIENDHHAYRIGKVGMGVVYDLPVAEHLILGIGGLASLNFVPDAIAHDYGGNHPTGLMGFVRLKID